MIIVTRIDFRNPTSAVTGVSAGWAGAGGPVMRDTIFRVGGALSEGQEGAVIRTIQHSFLVSADMVRSRDGRSKQEHAHVSNK